MIGGGEFVAKFVSRTFISVDFVGRWGSLKRSDSCCGDDDDDDDDDENLAGDGVGTGVWGSGDICGMLVGRLD